jgi:hypothetical protein
MAIPYDFSRCSRRNCHVTGYDVVAEAGAEAGTVQFSLVDPCNTMSDPCRAKAILLKVYRDWLMFLGESDDVLANCKYADGCPQGGPGMSFYYGSMTLVVETALAAPVAPVTVFVELPYADDCPNVFA